ncbi:MULTISPECIES: helix-turn-helix domain-containing protein [unclassified Coleofasciculus]|uniref:helix-turn-helix domain-containing protein n=1 Tax=unclassified Coleofasciculus TaxID=2692782 RepID=UPI001882023D|nr:MULTISPECIES: helix-turn-helix domain-containing protein [unclassified Coleofasciculus]MBE9129899.1 helix-turn-helix domain-containing protein [Coleofasciculus sp. LEGE 07081]MBE9150619.1 helix-turn-helix domain-containing protein [Coleofasciculus sp. LEGE 07092]
MPTPCPLNIQLSQPQRTLLEQLVRRHSSPQGLVQRAGVILLAAKGMNNTQIAQELQLARNTVRTWRQRWLTASEPLRSVEAEGISDKELLQMVTAVLADAPRPGTPATFTTEQVVQIIALACESPHGFERPVSHWTTQELVSEAVKRGIVDNISQRSVGRFLKGGYSTTTS